MKRLCLTVFTGGLLLATLGGCQSTASRPAGTIFQQMDRNGDTKVSREEFSAGFADALFTVYSRPHSGFITEAEWNGVERAGAGRSSFARLDTNHDGKLSYEEVSGGPQHDAVMSRLFSRIDKNHDGFISPAEGLPSGLDRTPVERAQGAGLL